MAFKKITLGNDLKQRMYKMSEEHRKKNKSKDKKIIRCF